MHRRYCSAVVALLATLLLSSAVGVTWVDVGGSTTESDLPASLVPTDATHSVSPGQPPADLAYVIINGSATGSNVFPWNYGSHTACRFQMMYLASEIGRSGTISQLALFKTGNTGYGDWPNVSIKLCHTNVSAVTTTYANNYGGNTPTWVYHGATLHRGTGATDQWDTLAITPFAYNGTDNLLIEVTWMGTETGSSASARTSSVSPTRRVYGWEDTLLTTGAGADASCYSMRIGFEDVTHNVGCTQVLAPAGNVDSGATVTPACSVYNYGSQAETYKVRLRIGAFTDSATVTAQPPSTAQYVTFANWTASGRGTFNVSCSTELAADATPGNDKDTGTVTVNVKDVGLVSIAVPTGTYPRDTALRPRATWHNYGTQAATFEAWALLSDPTDARVYSQKVDVPNLAAGGNLEVGTFPPCTLRVAGNWTVRCSTFLTADMKPANDTLDRAFTVGRLDMAVRAILAPTGSFDTAVAVTPTARAKNLGDAAATGVKVFFRIDSTPGNIIYRDSVTRDFAAGESANVVFAVWPKPHIPRGYTARCSAFVAGDPAPANNVLSAPFTVTSGGGGGYPWQSKAPMPILPSGKEVKDGGWLAYDSATSLVYASKGNKTADFFTWNPVTDSWKLLAPWPLGTDAKLPSKGSAGCADGRGVLYTTKGNNKSGFWKYDAATNAWTQKKDVPLGLSNKKVKGGTDIVWAHKGSIGSPYLLKGYKNEFYRYDVAADSWQVLPPAPVGANLKYDKGSWLAYDLQHTIYAHKAKYHEFYSYNTLTDSWNPTPLQAMPLVGIGGSKKSKDGGCGTYAYNRATPDSSGIYALKGGNTQQFWKYFPVSNSWVEKETLPKFPPKPKKVKAGADITTIPGRASGDRPDMPAMLPALTGNKTLNLSNYGPIPPYDFLTGDVPNRDGVASSAFSVQRSAFSVSPNPLAAGFVHLAVGGTSLSRPAMVRLYDAAGRCIGVWKPLLRNGSADLDVRHLAAGVYLVRVEADGFSASQKLVVQR